MRRRQALHLHAVRRLNVGEIAQVLQVSARTVNRDLKAARAKAKEQLEREAESAERLSDLAQGVADDSRPEKEMHGNGLIMTIIRNETIESRRLISKNTTLKEAFWLWMETRRRHYTK